MAYLAISRLAACDLDEIEAYSVETWGEQVAARYMTSIEETLQRLKDNPRLLRKSPGVSKNLRLYRVEKHFLVCALVEENIYLLTVKHGAMDLPERLAELEPALSEEAEILHEAFVKSLKSARRSGRQKQT